MTFATIGTVDQNEHIEPDGNWSIKGQQQQFSSYHPLLHHWRIRTAILSRLGSWEGQADVSWTVCTGGADHPSSKSKSPLCLLPSKVVVIPKLVQGKEFQLPDICSGEGYLHSTVSGGKGQSCATGKVYAALISSCHEGFGDRPIFSHPIVKHFLQGIRKQCLELHVPAPPSGIYRWCSRP